jgi:peptidoglycan L-alanyl-D-glutamate endopeptidase CwlK
MTDRKNKLTLLYSPLGELIKKTIDEANLAGIPVSLFESWRHPDRQFELYRQGKSKASAWQSWHQYGLAVDLVGYIDGKWCWDHRIAWQKLGTIGKSHGLTWGGDWQSADMVHFQFPYLIDIKKAKTIAEIDGILAVWDRL